MSEPSATTENQFIHRSKIWQVGFFSLNNAATNLYFFLIGLVSYYATGVAGLAVVVVSTILTALRIFDGITDPIIGFIIDRTNTRFGKFRPFMVLGNIILAVSTIIMFMVTHHVPDGLRLMFFIGMYAIHIIGYTFQAVCTRAAQTVLTNDPKQRPLFSAFDATFTTLIFVGGQVVLASYLVPKYGGQFSEALFTELVTYGVTIGAIFTILAVIGIWKKDRLEYFGFAEKSVKTKFSDYWPVIKRNRPLQMLVIAASTDKLANSVLRQPAVPVMFFGILIGNYALSGTIQMITILPTLLITYIGIGIARKAGMKRIFVYGTWAALLCFAGVLGLLMIIDPATISLTNMGLNTFLFLALYGLGMGFAGLTGNMVIPMIADTSDYETHITGRYVPGMISTIFSFVDKLISSLATTIVGFLLASIGFREVFPQVGDEMTSSLLIMTLVFQFGFPIFGWVASLLAMKFYELNGKRMNEIQDEIAGVKKILVAKNQITIPEPE
ncbi:MAG: MFS transporter [Bacillota bacterium]